MYWVALHPKACILKITSGQTKTSNPRVSNFSTPAVANTIMSLPPRVTPMAGKVSVVSSHLEWQGCPPLIQPNRQLPYRSRTPTHQNFCKYQIATNLGLFGNLIQIGRKWRSQIGRHQLIFQRTCLAWLCQDRKLNESKSLSDYNFATLAIFHLCYQHAFS